MRRVLPLAFILLTWLPAETQAVTAKEILELSRAGLSEEVLLALIEVDGGVFTLDTATLKSLKEGGVSERVILAMVRSGRTPAVEPAPQPVVSEPGCRSGADDRAAAAGDRDRARAPGGGADRRSRLCGRSSGSSFSARSAPASRSGAVRSITRIRCTATRQPSTCSRRQRARVLGVGRQVAP